MSEVRLPSTIIGALQALAAWLDHEQVPNAIIGAVGVSLAAQPRLTKDIDGVIWLESDRWEGLIRSASENGFSLRRSDSMAFAKRARVRSCGCARVNAEATAALARPTSSNNLFAAKCANRISYPSAGVMRAPAEHERSAS